MSTRAVHSWSPSYSTGRPYASGSGVPLGWCRATEIGAAIADGLAAAHRAGIVHRDLKPANVFLTHDGRVKILDFGLARHQNPLLGGDGAEAPTLTHHTEPGTTLGTVGYMAPEQVRGEVVDSRSDIFSLGCVLFEMVTGRPPFQRDTAAETMAAVLRDEIPVIESSAGAPPPTYVRLVRRCLEKRAASRHQSAGEVAVALRTLQDAHAEAITGAPPVSRSIAVLPFANLSPDPENAFFADGLSEVILTDLSKIASLRVTSRTSAWRFKDAAEDIPTIAAQLGVRYLLEGSVQRAGEQLRITAQLIDAASDAHLWAERYAGTMDDVFDIQEKVSRAIVEELKVRLTPEERRRIAERPIEDVHAYDCYLKARNELFVNTPASLERALQYLQNGLEICGENALLLAGIGYVHFQQVNWGFAQEETAATAEEFADRALQLNPDSAEGHLVLGLVHQIIHADQSTCVAHLKRALETDPNHYEALFWSIVALSLLGKFHAVEPLVERLQQIDPLNPRTPMARSFLEVYSGQFEAAIEHSRAALEQEPEIFFFQDAHAFCLAYGGRLDEFRALADTFELTASDYSIRRMILLLRRALEDDREGYLELLDERLTETARRDLEFSQHVADSMALLGDTVGALEWLENAFRRGFLNYPFLAEYDPFLASLRGTPELERFLVRVKDAWERFEV